MYLFLILSFERSVANNILMGGCLFDNCFCLSEEQASMLRATVKWITGAGGMVDHQHGGSWLVRESWRRNQGMGADWVLRGLVVAWCVCRLGRGALPAAPQPVALAVHLKDVDMVGEPVQQRSRQSFRAKHLGPLVEGQVCGDQYGAPLVALAEDLKQQFRSGAGQVVSGGDKKDHVAGSAAFWPLRFTRFGRRPTGILPENVVTPSG